MLSERHVQVGAVTRDCPVGSSRVTLWWARILCLSAFGPYVTGSARTEQIVVFGSLGVIMLVGWPLIMQARNFAPAPFVITWSALYAIMLIATVWRPIDLSFYGAQPASHGLSALLLPLALIIVTWFWTLSADGTDLIGAVAPVIVGAMTVNATVSFAQLTTGKVAVLGFLPHFWGASDDVASVAVLAAGDGRFTGIFDQPAEAGIAYGMALFCLIWLARRQNWKPLLVAACAMMLIAGGAITLSKVFLLGALPLAALTALCIGGHGRIRVAAWSAAAAATLWFLAAAGLAPTWSGLTAIRAYTHPAASLVSQYSAGRYGAGGSLGPVVGDVLQSSPWSGFGGGGLNVAYDSLWVEVLVVSGVLGIVLAATMFALMAARWTRLRPVLKRPESHLAGAALALAAGASLGIPSLTANRGATLIWLVIGVLVTGRVPLVVDPPHPKRLHQPAACALETEIWRIDGTRSGGDGS